MYVCICEYICIYIYIVVFIQLILESFPHMHVPIDCSDIKLTSLHKLIFASVSYTHTYRHIHTGACTHRQPSRGYLAQHADLLMQALLHLPLYLELSEHLPPRSVYPSVKAPRLQLNPVVAVAERELFALWMLLLLVVWVLAHNIYIYVCVCVCMYVCIHAYR